MIIMRHAIVIALLAAPFAPAPALASDRCATLRQPASRAARGVDAMLVSHVGRQKVSADHVGPVLAEGDWRVVFATPGDAERGVFFFKRDGRRRFQLVDTWGGVIPPDERASTIAWIGKHYHQPPARLTACVVDAVIAGK